MDTKNETGKNLPEKKIRAGAISVTIWQNKGQNSKTGEEVVYKTISIDRRYMDKNGEWQSTNSFRTNDLPKLSAALNKAFEFLVLKEQDIAA